MADLFVDDDADLSLVQDRNVAVLGYGDLAAAHALCLRDSGVDVRVGLDAGSAPWDDAVGDGLRVVTTYEACEEADLVVLTPTAAEDRAATEALLLNLVAGDAVVLQESASLSADVPAGVDVIRLVSWAPGLVVRDEFAQGRGVPVFASVVRDGSGGAWDLALAYARAVGATRAGVVRASDDDYLRSRTYASTLLGDAVLPAVRAAFDSLVTSGCQPEIAYLQCVYSMRLFADDLVGGALDVQLERLRRPHDDDPGPDPLLSTADLVRSLMVWERRQDTPLH